MRNFTRLVSPATIATLSALVLCALPQAPTPAVAAAPLKEITVGFNPAENADAMESNGKEFSAYYQKKTGLSVKTFVATDYTALIEAMRSGRIDFAFLPAFSIVKAEDIAHAKVLMKAVRKGKSVLYSAIIVRTDKPYNKIEDLKGKSIAWVDPASSSGFIIPKAALLTKKKINADDFFGKQVFAGAHDALVLSVLNGTVDAGATYSNDKEGKDSAWHQFLKSPEDQKKLKPIFVSDPIPTDGLATTEKFEKEHPEVVEQFVKNLETMGKDPEGHKILEELYRLDSMTKATSKEFQPLRDAAKLIGVE